MLQGKRIFVTGGNRRLGLGIAEILGKSGGKLGITYRGDKSRSEDALSRLPDDAVAIRANLNQPDTLEQVVIDAENALGGPIDILVNNAAAFEYDTIASVTAENLHLHLDVGLIAPVLLTRYVTRHKKREYPGLILNILDYKIHNPFPDFLSYTVTKHALEGFTRLAARDLAPDWRVCGVAPGYTLRAPQQSQKHFSNTHNEVPLKRGSRVEDIGETIIYLANAPAITGQTITVDGGAHMMAQTSDFSLT